MPRQPRGKRTTTADGDIEVVSKNSNGDGSVSFEPERTSKDGKVRPGYRRASYRDAGGNRRTVSGPTRVQAESHTPSDRRRHSIITRIEDGHNRSHRHISEWVTARDRAARIRVRRLALAGWLGCLGWCEGVARRPQKFRAPSRTTGTGTCRLPRPGGPERRVRTRTGATRAAGFDRYAALWLGRRQRSGWLLRRRLRRRSSHWLIRDRKLQVLEIEPASPPRVQASVEMR